ncbi:MAG TPA: M48 family metallopeptidase [Thermoanaerobaculia bacterium]|nr:M48 family metallopeptidase [Thermoanaerobaculia bacterium]
MRRLAILLIVLAAIARPAAAQSATAEAPAAASAANSSRFDPEEATRAYLASMPAADRARSDAYFEGGYWLLLWDFLAGAALSLLLLASGLSLRMRAAAERISRRKPIQTALYWTQYLVVTSLVLFPLTIYEGYFREHKYGLSNQTVGAWLGDQAKGFGVSLVFGGLAVMCLYGVLRKTPRSWWLWGSLTAIAILVLGILVAPVYVAPLFNKYKKLEDPKVRDPILALARANGIAVTDVYEFDASRQSKRMSANVSGFLGTERISMNDNLLNRGSVAEIQAVMGHEMGHYVLHHVYKGILAFGVLIVVGFAVVRLAFDRIRAATEPRWRIRAVGDVAGLPLLVLLTSTYFFLLTPVVNTLIRTQEGEADIFGINASQQPDGMAQAALHLAEYRKLDPGKLEEFVFFDHPSGKNRILMAMRWKAEHRKR